MKFNISILVLAAILAAMTSTANTALAQEQPWEAKTTQEDLLKNNEQQSTQAAEVLTLEDIYKHNRYGTKGVVAFRWNDDGKSFLTMQPNPELKGLDIIRNDVATGEKSIYISASQLIPKNCSHNNAPNDSKSNSQVCTESCSEESGSPIVIHDFQWSADHSKLLIYSNSKRVWRYNTRGDYWVYTPATGQLQQIGKGFEPSRLMFAKFSPDASKVAFVYKNNIYSEDLATGIITKLTADGTENSDEIVNGTFDWVYEEELSQRDGFRWSSDSKKIAYWQFDTRGTGTFYMVNNIDSVYAEIIPLPYPKAGTTNSAARIGVVEVNDNTQDAAQTVGTGQSDDTIQETGANVPATRWFDIPGDPREHYLARMNFIPGTNEVMIQQLNRLQNTNIVYFGNVDTMELTEVLTETDEAFLDVHDDIIWLDGGKYFTWTSERSGWRHLYKVSKDGSEITPITKGEFDVISVACFDTKGGYVYYIASPDSPTERYLYRSRLNGKGEAQRITPADAGIGHHSYDISPDAKYAMHTFSNSETPNRYELIALNKHRSLRTLEDNSELASRFATVQTQPKEFFKVNTGEIVLDGWMIKPSDFDSTKCYPVIFYIYGEPASSTVQNSWSRGEFWSRFLAEQGYIVMSLDPRGVNTPRGREWRKCVYGKVGIIPPADHAAAVTELIKTYSYIDPERIGVWGWSGGGSSTTHLMFKFPDIYSTGIAVAGVYSQYLYDTIYQERYMGLPSTNPQGFHDGSPINFAKNLQGNLMLIHGTGDDNVHYQSCELLVNELVKQNKMFDMFTYPMRGHSINERENTTYHLYQTMLRYWLENLPAGAR